MAEKNTSRSAETPRVQKGTGGLVRAKGSGLTAPNGEAYDHRFIASTERVASDGGVILATAWRLDEYKQRPRWIAMHDIMGYSAPINQVTLGRCVDVLVEEGLPTEFAGPTGRGLVQYMRYASTPFAQEVKTLYDEGGLDDVSVRWDPRTEVARAPFMEESQRYGEDCYWVATRADLIETSAVLLGADAGAKHLRVSDKAMEAFERARSAGAKLPELEAFIHRAEREARIVVAVRAALDAERSAAAMDTDERGATTDGAAVIPGKEEDIAQVNHDVADSMEKVVREQIDDADLVEDDSQDHRSAVRGVDAAAMTDCLEQMDRALSALDAVLSAVGPVRQQIGDSVTLVKNLVAAALDSADEVTKALTQDAEATTQGAQAAADQAGAQAEQKATDEQVAAVAKDQKKKKAVAEAAAANTHADATLTDDEVRDMAELQDVLAEAKALIAEMRAAVTEIKAARSAEVAAPVAAGTSAAADKPEKAEDEKASAASRPALRLHVGAFAKASGQ